MYNQKFNPYGRFPSKTNQLYEQQYEEEESQPLVEEVDDSYQPTQRQVKEYAIETLGMKFPEDEGLLYLAREGLKAPLPDNWVPYQGRDGEVYYKHRITQEKTYDHPTDIEYRKKYEQQKQKMARKNLKSMNMKASNQIGLGPNANNLNSNASNLFGSKMSNSNMFGANPISSINQSTPSVKLDPRIQQQYEDQLEQFDERMKRQWKNWQIQERQRCENRIKLLKQQYESQIENIFKGKQKQVKVQEKIKEQKQKIKSRIQQKLEQNLKDELRQYEKQLQNKNRQFITVYEQDTQLKINKFQQQKDSQFQEREHKLKDFIDKMTISKENKKRQIQQTLKRLRNQFQRGENREIEIATAEALEQELNAIKLNYAQKIKDREAELERQYMQTKRILGFDQNAYLSEIAAKKSRIKAISQQKIQSFKKKQTQSLNLKYENQLEEALRNVKKNQEIEYSMKLVQQRHHQQELIAKQKQKLDKQFKSKIDNNIQNIYDEMKSNIKNYEAEMNKKLSSVQQRFINDIYTKTRNPNKDVTFRIQSKQKQMLIQNKQMIIQSLKRQRQLQLVTLQLMKLQAQIYQSKNDYDVDQKLLKLAKMHGLQYRTDKYLRLQSSYKEIKEKYKKDKQFLASVMTSLQNYKGSNSIGSQAILKQYNQDVRKMRQNEQILRRMQSLLKKAEINDKSALQELDNSEFFYKEIQLKKQMIRTGSNSTQVNIQQIKHDMIPETRQGYGGIKDIESALKDHSKFLSNMRNELNRKLYKIRSGTYY